MKPFYKITISIFLLSILSGCYTFDKPPYKSSELIPLKDSKLGELILENIHLVPTNDFTRGMKQGLNDQTMAKEITSDFIITQNQGLQGWELGVITKNSHHLMLCALFENENLQLPSTVTTNKSGDSIGFSGNQEDLKNIADLLTLSGPKICIAVPYAEVK